MGIIVQAAIYVAEAIPCDGLVFIGSEQLDAALIKQSGFCKAFLLHISQCEITVWPRKLTIQFDGLAIGRDRVVAGAGVEIYIAKLVPNMRVLCIHGDAYITGLADLGNGRARMNIFDMI